MSRTYRAALPLEPAWEKPKLSFAKLSSSTWKASKQMVFPFLSLVATSNTSTFLSEPQTT